MRFAKSFSIIAFLLTFALQVFAHQQATVEEYINKYKYIAVREMQRSGIPASIKLAQAILESGMGTSRLATLGNNHFGIKCHKEWSGNSMKHTDDAPNECFRVYTNPEESFVDHSHFLTSRPRYSELFTLSRSDYKAWAYGLKKAGYATNPRYAEMLIDVIERHQLYVYDIDLPIDQLDQRRNVIQLREKEELIVLQNKTAPVGTFERNLEVSVPASKPSAMLKDASATATNVVFTNNNVKVIKASEGQTLRSIAQQQNISLTRLMEFNDMKPKDDVKPGQLVYLEAKKTKAERRTHLVLAQDNMWSISQAYGIRLSKLYERNLLRPGEEPAVGAMIYLNKVAPKKPALRPKNFKEAGKEVTVSVSVGSSPSVTPPPADHTTVSTPVARTPAYTQPVQVSAPQVDSRPTVSTPARPGISGKQVVHVVKQGDTLYNLSRRYGVSIVQIKEWNQIPDENIKLGQELIIFQN